MWEVHFHKHLSQQSTIWDSTMLTKTKHTWAKNQFYPEFLSDGFPGGEKKGCDTSHLVNMSTATILYLNRCNSGEHFIFPSPSRPVTASEGFLKTSSSVVSLTRNWAMSKAKSWTKLNRCSANEATRPKLDVWSSGSPGTSLLTTHKVTDTTSQQSWAAR